MFVWIDKKSFGSADGLVFKTEDPNDNDNYLGMEVPSLEYLSNYTIINDGFNSYRFVLRPSPDHVWDPEQEKWVPVDDVAKHRLETERTACMELIDNTVADIYKRFTCFSEEYHIREAQAQAYKDAGYQGDIPRQVAAFATPTGITPQEAADIILQQAANLREALNALGELRMRKNELKTPQTLPELQTLHASIMQAIITVSETLK